MKRYVKLTNQVTHLSDLIKNISFIIFCEDIQRTPCTISAAEKLEDDQELTDEQMYVTLSDEQLANMSEDKIHTFTNIELLRRIAKIDLDKLTDAQIDLIRTENRSTKLEVSRQDVEDLLIKLKKCDQISYEGRHWKTNRFLTDAEGNVRKDECIKVIHNLKVSDYVKSSLSDNIYHLGNNVTIFQPKVKWKTANGMLIKNLTVYIKLDIDETTGTTVAIISFHDTVLEDEHPFA